LGFWRGLLAWIRCLQAGDDSEEDIILVELSLKELLHLTWLAHLGFNHMMPIIAASRPIASPVTKTPEAAREPSKDSRRQFPRNIGRSMTPQPKRAAAGS
jgi:hypothetical protein